MTMMRPGAALLLAGLLLGACARGGGGPPLDVVRGFEAERYLGTWHQIAFIPNRFQSQCVADTTATYAPAPEPGWIKVVNACRTGDGDIEQVDARARFVGEPGEARLEVAFVELLGQWLWPIAGAYQVIALDPDYRWALVAHPSRDYAWILAREPVLDDATLAMLRDRLTAAGYDSCRLVLTADLDPRRGQALCRI